MRQLKAFIYNILFYIRYIVCERNGLKVPVRQHSVLLKTSTPSLRHYSHFDHEPENLDFIDGINPKAGENYFDLGAAEGRFSLYAAAKGIPTYTFEPDQNNFKALTDNKHLNRNNGGNNLHAFNVAAGDSDHTDTLLIGQPWEGGHHKIVASAQGRDDIAFTPCDSQKIQVVSLDSFIQKQKIPTPTHLKIDVDGSETPALEGMKKTLKNPALKEILIELETTQENYASSIKAITSAGFTEAERFVVEDIPTLVNIWFKRA